LRCRRAEWKKQREKHFVRLSIVSKELSIECPLPALPRPLLSLFDTRAQFETVEVERYRIKSNKKYFSLYRNHDAKFEKKGARKENERDSAWMLLIFLPRDSHLVRAVSVRD